MNDTKETKAGKPTLSCGHPKSEWRIIRYRCNLAPHCFDRHVIGECQICFDAGKRPSDFGYEIKRTKT